MSSIVPENQMTQNNPSLVQVNQTQTNQLTSPSGLEKLILFGRQFSAIIDQIPEYWASFWQAYQSPLIVFAWVVVGFIILKVALAILSAISGIPLLAPLLQVIGLSYSLWFTFRNLVSFSSRQQILARLNRLKEYVWGNPDNSVGIS